MVSGFLAIANQFVFAGLPVVRQTIELGGTLDPAPVAGGGGAHHIGAEAVAEHVVSGDLLQVVDEVDALGVGHLGENLPVGMGGRDALFVAVGTAVSQLGAVLDDGQGGDVAAVGSLAVEDIQDLLDHPVGLAGLGGLEGGVGSRGAERGLAEVLHGVIDFNCYFLSSIQR